MKTRSIYLLIIAVFLQHQVIAQQLLTPENAVDIALKNNYDILVSRQSVEMAKANNTLGNAGMLPSVSLNASGTATQKSEYQKLSAGGESTVNPNRLSAAAGVELGWTLFDGGKMFITRGKLGELEKLGAIQLQETVQQTMYDVVAAYYNLVRLNQQRLSMDQAVRYNEERVRIAEAAFMAGRASKPDLLQAQIDLNTAKESTITQGFSIVQAKRSLNLLLGRDANVGVSVTDTIINSYKPDAQALIQALKTNNATLLAFQKQVEINKLALDESKSGYLPSLNLTAGLYQSLGSNSVGSVQSYSNFGPEITGRLSVPIFKAGELKRKKELASINLQTSELAMENLQLEMNRVLQNALDDYSNQKKLLDIEEANALLTKECLEISIQRLRWGQTNSLEVHLALENFVNSNTRLGNFRYSLKLAETKLKQLVSR